MQLVYHLSTVPEKRQLNLKSLYATLKKKRGKAKVKASVIVEIGEDQQATPIKAKIVFVKDKNKSKNWLALISTHISLMDEEIVRIYGKCWDIEVFFKMNKSFLNLAKEFQGRSYESMVAHTTIVFTRYIVLSTQSRNNEDLRTIGVLFFNCCDELVFGLFYINIACFFKGKASVFVMRKLSYL